MFRCFIVAVLLLVHAGCASRGPVVDEGNATGVVVAWNRSTGGSSGALAVADQHCQRYGRAARYSGKPNAFLLAYDCVSP
jgi:hypothetical protein